SAPGSDRAGRCLPVAVAIQLSGRGDRGRHAGEPTNARRSRGRNHADHPASRGRRPRLLRPGLPLPAPGDPRRDERVRPHRPQAGPLAGTVLPVLRPGPHVDDVHRPGREPGSLRAVADRTRLVEGDRRMSATLTAPPSEARRRVGLLAWLTTTNHKQIGWLYLGGTFLFFLAGGLLALLIRIQLAQPDMSFLSRQAYNEVFTIHGTTMVFLVIAPIGLGLANYFVPLHIGAPDMPV